MAEPIIPPSVLTEFSKHLVSKILPEKACNYLAAFLPGSFFEISVFIGNPDLVRNLMAKNQAGLNLGRSGLLIVGLYLAFMIGNGLMLLVGIIDRFLGRVYRVLSFLWKVLCIRALLPALNKLIAKKVLKPRHWTGRFSMYVSGELMLSQELQEFTIAGITLRGS